jgi:hypothetical protein
MASGATVKRRSGAPMIALETGSATIGLQKAPTLRPFEALFQNHETEIVA